MPAIGIIAIFIPIVFLVGLFGSIALSSYFKHRTNAIMAERLPSDALGTWVNSRQELKLQLRTAQRRNRSMGLRIGGLLVGIGVGTAIGCILLACGITPEINYAEHHGFNSFVIATFLVIALAMFCGGLGMVGAYFMERRFDGKSE
jgi:hypothetical protein